MTILVITENIITREAEIRTIPEEIITYWKVLLSSPNDF